AAEIPRYVVGRIVSITRFESKRIIPMNTLDQIQQIRDAGREERFERALQLTTALQDAVREVRFGTPFSALPANVREHLVSCSEAYFNSFAELVQGKRRTIFPQPPCKKAS